MMSTKKKATKKKTAKKTAKKKVPAKKTTAKKATKKKATKKTGKKVAKKSKAKKAAPKKKAAKKASPAKGKKKATTKKKAAPKKKASSKDGESKKPAPQALPKLGPETLKIRERLLEKRRDLLKLIQSSKSLERDVGDLTFSNEIDLASSLEGREMVFQLTSRDRNELRLIEDALFRINEGTYGACESCEKKISLKRLQIMPLTSLCIDCQEAAENL